MLTQDYIYSIKPGIESSIEENQFLTSLPVGF